MTDEHLYDTRNLINRIGEGDERAFTLLFKRYSRKIYSLAFHLTNSEVYAEEIVQDVFLKIWLKQDQLTKIDDFESYLFISARNHIYTCLKAIAKQKTLADVNLQFLAEENSPEAMYLVKEYTNLLREAVEQLPVQQSQVYRLSKEEGKSREQISQVMHISPETVKVHLARAMRSVRAYLIKRSTIPFFGPVLLLCF